MNECHIDIAYGADDEVISFCENSTYGAPLLKYNHNELFVIKIHVHSVLLGLIAFRIKQIYSIFKLMIVDMAPIVNPNKIIDDDLVLSLIYNELKKFALDKKISYLYFSHWTRETDNTYLIKNQFNIKIYNSFILDITKDENEIFNSFDSKKRNMIRKGLKNPIDIKILEKKQAISFVSDFHTLLKETQRRAIKANKNSSMQLKSEHYIKTILQSTNASLALAYYDDKLVAGAVIIYSGETLYYYLGCSDKSLNRITAAADLLQWEIIKYGKSKKLKYYDFGGVPVNPGLDHPGFGVYKFKESFGGELKTFYGGLYSRNLIFNWLFTNVVDNKIILRMINKFSITK